MAADIYQFDAALTIRINADTSHILAKDPVVCGTSSVLRGSTSGYYCTILAVAVTLDRCLWYAVYALMW